MKNLLFNAPSWKTTLSGIGQFFVVLVTQLLTLIDTTPEGGLDLTTNPDWSLLVASIMVLIGMFKARDNDVSSEEAGAVAAKDKKPS